MNVVTLDKLRPGEAGAIREYTKAEDLHHRLKELGLVVGTQVRVRCCAPLGDPMELSVRGYHLSIRKQDAAHILVERQDGLCGQNCGCGRQERHRRRGEGCA